MSLVILNRVDAGDAGAASTLPGVGQQVGGSIGLAVAGTVAWSAVASSLRPAAAKAAVHVSGAEAAALHTQSYRQALATGFSRGFVVSGGMLALAMIVALAVVWVRRQDLAGASLGPKPAGDTSSPTTAG